MVYDSPRGAFDKNYYSQWQGSFNDNNAYWLGMVYDSPREVLCLSYLDLKVNDSGDSYGAKKFKIEGRQTSSSIWKEIMIVEEPLSGRRENFPLRPYSLPPSLQPTLQPTPQPSLPPTPYPSPRPTLQPTLQPTLRPTPQPSLPPTPHPSLRPTLQPSLQKSLTPTLQPSLHPSLPPSSQPSLPPTTHPSLSSTLHPSLPLTLRPSLPSSLHPTQQPSLQLSLYTSMTPQVIGCVVFFVFLIVCAVLLYLSQRRLNLTRRIEPSPTQEELESSAPSTESSPTSPVY